MSVNIKFGNNIINRVDVLKVQDADSTNKIAFAPVKPTQDKRVTPSSIEKKISADPGYELSEVTVEAINVETKEIHANGTYPATSGKYISQVIVDIPIYDGEVEDAPIPTNFFHFNDSILSTESFSANVTFRADGTGYTSIQVVQEEENN